VKLTLAQQKKVPGICFSDKEAVTTEINNKTNKIKRTFLLILVAETILIL